MGRIASAFKRLGKVNEAALIPYLTVGHPSVEVTRQVVPVMTRQGADLVILGRSFSEPAPHGVTPQQPPLHREVTLDECLSVAAEARRANEIPIIIITEYQTIRRYGLDHFAGDCAASGIDGLVVPDLPPNQAAVLKAACPEGLDLIFLLDPTGDEAHLGRAAELGTGFVYCVSSGGAIDVGMESLIARVRRHTDLPVVIGSGITTPQQVAQALTIADGVVIGNALIELIGELPEDEIIGGVAEYIRELKEATVRLIPDP